MNLSECRIVEGRAFNISENKAQPLTVFGHNLDAINGLLALIEERYPRACFVGSSCMYPLRDAALREEMLGTGEVYEGNALYSYTKLLGWQICKAVVQQLGLQFFMVIPSDVFGEANSTHFVADMMRKFHRAKEENAPVVQFWGTGTPVRHPLFREDYERILHQLCDSYTGTDVVNIAPPVSYAKSVGSIAQDIRDIVGYEGTIEWDAAHPDGQKVKILDNTRLAKLGFTDFTPWKESLERTYNEIKNNF